MMAMMMIVIDGTPRKDLAGVFGQLGMKVVFGEVDVAADVRQRPPVVCRVVSGRLAAPRE